MTTRPTDRMGLNPDGVHRYLYEQSRKGDLYVWPKMAAAEYGASLEDFNDQVSVLAGAGLVKECPVRGSTRTHYYQITKPAGYDSNDYYLGQRGPGALAPEPKHPVTEMNELVAAYLETGRDSQDEDAVALLEDTRDEYGF